jgi:hypothetical protein
VEKRVAILKPAHSTSDLERDNVDHRLFMLVDRDKISLPQPDPTLTDQSILIPVTQNFEQEFATWLLSYGIDIVEVEALNNLLVDLREVCSLLGVSCILKCLK